MSAMDQLREAYRSRLPEKIVSLEAALAAGASGVAELRRLAHALRGSGGSYGFPVISEAAGAVEEASPRDLAPLARRLIEVLSNPDGDARSAQVLVISADKETRDRLREVLRGDDRVVVMATSGARAKTLIARATPALILLDLLLPDVDSRRLLQRLRATPELEELPLIVLAKAGNSRLREECFALGADQYFDKACDLSLLAVSVDHALSKVRQSASTTQMRVMSRLLSRAAFEDLFQRRLRARSERGRALIFIDLGELGDEGDEVLHRVAGSLLKKVRLGDHLARWDETHLVLLAHKTHRHGEHALLNRLQEGVEAEVFRTSAGRTFNISLQAGVVSLERDLPPLEEVIARAQAALLSEQKRLGVTAGARDASQAQSVLLAEDDPEFAAFVRFALTQGGYEVRHLPDGLGVLQYALENPVALFLLDGNLPGKSGFDVLREIRESPVLRETPVALLTALGGEQDVVRGLELGADDYIVKPCSARELLTRVRRLIRLRNAEKPGKELSAGGVSGRIAGDQLCEVLQMLGANGKSGRLTVWGGGLRGHLDVSQGRVVDAACSGGSSGMQAAHEILACQEGRFEFDPTRIAAGSRGPLDQGVPELLMESMRRRDELH